MSWWRRDREDQAPDHAGRAKMRGRSRSVWDDRDRLGDHTDEWRQLGELDPVTGRGRVDYSRATGWRSLGEFLRR